MVLDISVPPAAMEWVEDRSTSQAAEALCAAEDAPFDGWALARVVLGLPGTTAPVSLGVCAEVPVGDALIRRGGIVVNRAGRVGVVIARNRVVQPAGRSYTLADTDPTWWVTGYLSSTVTATMLVSLKPITVVGGGGETTPLPFNRAGSGTGAVAFNGSTYGTAGSRVGAAAGSVGFGGVATSGGARAGGAAGAVQWVGAAAGARPSGAGGFGTGWFGTSPLGVA